MSSTHVFDTSGGALCLAFANTVGDRPRCKQEHLASYSDLVEWGRQAEVVDENEAALLEAQSSRRRKKAAAAFERALELREAIYRLFSSLAAGRRPKHGDLELLNQRMAEALPNLEVTERQGVFEWCWTTSAPQLDRVLWPVARSAAELLTSGDGQRVKECSSGTCSWRSSPG